MVKCTYGDCNNEGQYATYQLFADGTKRWRTDLCDRHEKLIVNLNGAVKSEHSYKEYREVYDV